MSKNNSIESIFFSQLLKERNTSLFLARIKDDKKLLQRLLEMGYERKKIEKALIACKNAGIEEAVELLCIGISILQPLQVFFYALFFFNHNDNYKFLHFIIIIDFCISFGFSDKK